MRCPLGKVIDAFFSVWTAVPVEPRSFLHELRGYRGCPPFRRVPDRKGMPPDVAPVFPPLRRPALRSETEGDLRVQDVPMVSRI